MSEEAKHVLLQNNSEDVRLSEKKLSHECETPKSKVSSIKDKFKGFGKKKKKREGRVKREVKKGEKRKVGKQNFYTKPSDLTHA